MAVNIFLTAKNSPTLIFVFCVRWDRWRKRGSPLCRGGAFFNGSLRETDERMMSTDKNDEVSDGCQYEN